MNMELTSGPVPTGPVRGRKEIVTLESIGLSEDNVIHNYAVVKNFVLQ